MRKARKKLLMTLCCLVLALAMGLPVFAQTAAEPAAAAPDAPDASVSDGGTSAAADPEGPSEETPVSEEAPGAALPPEGEPDTSPLPEEEQEAAPPPEPPDEAQEEAAEEGDPAGPYGLVLDAGSIVVDTYADLKKALGEDNGFTTVYLGADITAEGSPAPIHPGKPFVVIDGSPPSGGRHTFTQYSAANTNGLFVVDSTATQTREVTLRNMDVTGKNDYGLVWVNNSVTTVTLTLENVNYSGPQALHHRNGTVRVIGGRYTLPAGELAEALHAELGGELTIEGPAGNAVLWLVSGSSTLKILQGANVQVNTKNYFVYGTIAAARLEADARLDLVSKRFGFSYAADSVGTFTLAGGAALSIDLDTTESYAALRVSKRFEMAPESSATILRTGTAGIPLRLTAAGAQAVFDRPRRVFLYSGAGVPLRFTGEGTLSITTAALNVWSSTPWPLPDGMATRPGHIWNRADGLLTVTGSYYEAANRGLSSNLSAGDPVRSALDKDTFNLEKNQLLAFGHATLEIDTPAAGATALAGESAPGAELSATYTAQEAQDGETGGAADLAGRYSLPVSGGGLMAGGGVTVVSRSNGLFMRKTAVVRQGEQKLAFLAVPEKISFGAPPIPGSPLYVERQQATFGITVQDTRENPAPWRIDASLAAPPDTGLPSASAIVFVTKDGRRLTLNEAPQPVHSHTDATGGTIDIQWSPGEGVLLNVLPGEVYSNRTYQAAIHWTLVDAP